MNRHSPDTPLMTGQFDPTLQARQAAEAAVVSPDTVWRDWDINGTRSTTVEITGVGDFFDGHLLAETLAVNKSVAVLRVEDPNNPKVSRYYAYGGDSKDRRPWMVSLPGFNPSEARGYSVPEGQKRQVFSPNKYTALQQPHALGKNMLLPTGEGLRIRSVIVSTDLFGKPGLFSGIRPSGTAIKAKQRDRGSDILSGQGTPMAVRQQYTTESAGSIAPSLTSASINADPTKIARNLHQEARILWAEKQRAQAAQAAGTVAVGRR